jgi:hypothetical protein
MGRDRHGAEHLKRTNPDKGPPMMEGMHHFDKGYDSDGEVFERSKEYPNNHKDEERGNEYVKLNREIISRDSQKLKRGHFTKIA